MSKYDKIYVLFLSLMILVFVFSGNYKRAQISSIDNRYLTEFPEKIDENFSQQLADYVQDRIGFRNLMVSLYINFNNKVFRIVPNSIYGKNDHLFGAGKEYLASYQHLDGDLEHAEYFTEYLKKLQCYCNSKGCEFLYMLNPDKITIYPEEMPESINVYDADNLTQQIKIKVAEKNVRHIFADEVLAKDKTGKQLFYKRYDVAHWSDYGRFLAVNAVLEELSMKPMSITEDFEESNILVEKQIVSEVIINDEITGYSAKRVYEKEELEENGKITFANPGVFGVFKNMNDSSQEKPRLLLLSDSYLMNHLDYFGDNFSKIMRVHADDLDKIQMLIDSYKPDILIFENVERVMSTFYSKDRMKNYQNHIAG